MTNEELRARVRELIASGDLPKEAPVQRAGPVFRRFKRACLICGGPDTMVACFWRDGRVTYLHAACDAVYDAVWMQEHPLAVRTAAAAEWASRPSFRRQLVLLASTSLHHGTSLHPEDWKDVDGLLAMAKAQKVFFRIGLAVCGALAVLGLFFSSEDARLAFLLAAFSFVAVFRLFTVLGSTGALVLWVRRFHQGQKKGAWRIHTQLDLGCRGIASLITLQDSTVPVSRWAGLRSPFGLIVMFFVCTLGPRIGAFVLDSFFFYETLPPGGQRRLAEFAMSVLVAGALFFWLLRKLAVVRANEENPRKAWSFRLGLGADKALPGGRLIVRCPHNETAWREVVGLGIEQANAVVIDVTSFSDNVVWELMSALATHPPSKILLLCSDERIADLQFIAKLANSRGCDASALLRCRRLVYPFGLSWLGDRRRKREFIDSLRRNLAACLISSRERDVPPYPLPSS